MKQKQWNKINISLLHWQINWEFLGLRKRNFQGIVPIWPQIYRVIFRSTLVHRQERSENDSGIFNFMKVGITYLHVSKRISCKKPILLSENNKRLIKKWASFNWECCVNKVAYVWILSEGFFETCWWEWVLLRLKFISFHGLLKGCVKTLRVKGKSETPVKLSLVGK